jgi:hypothetical protein
MAEERDGLSVREAVAVFDTEESLQDAIDELLSSGFNQADLSLLASEATVEAKLGHRYRKVEELEDAPKAPHAAYISPESYGDAEGAIIGALMYVGAGVLMGPIALAGGGIAAIATGAVAGGALGGGIGAILAILLGQSHAERITKQIEHGGLLLWTRVWNEEQERHALEILAKHSGRDVHVHALSDKH